jgi:hypothetical protein
MAATLRELRPGAAWHEAERRAIAVGIAGFVAAGVLRVFEALRTSFPAATAMAAGSFLAALSLYVGYYHRRSLFLLPVSVCTGTAPFVVNVAVFKITTIGNQARFIVLVLPTAVVGMALYVALHALHARLASLTPEGYLRQLAFEDGGGPTGRWQTAVFWGCVVLGALVLWGFLQAGR